MYKHSGLLVIAALIISSIGILSPTATPTVSAYTAPTVSLTQTKVRDNAWALFTLTVNNTSGSDNIENVLVLSNGFTEPIGGDNVKENLDNLADNLIAVTASTAPTGITVQYNFTHVRDNFLEAVTNIKAAGAAMVTMATYQLAACANFDDFTENDNMMSFAYALDDAPQYWTNAGNLLQTEPFNFRMIAENIRLAAAAEDAAAKNILRAGSVSQGVAASADNALLGMAENISDNFTRNAMENGAAVYFENRAAENMDNLLNLYNVGQHFENAFHSWDNVGFQLVTTYQVATLALHKPSMLDAGHNIDNMADKMLEVADNFKRAAENVREAGVALSFIENNYLENARYFWARSSRDVDLKAGWISVKNENLIPDNFLDNLVTGILCLSAGTPIAGVDNDVMSVMRFGDNLELAVGSPVKSTVRNRPDLVMSDSFKLGNVENENFRWLGPELGGDIIGYTGESASITDTIRAYFRQAADNLDNENCISLTNAANALYNAGTRFADLGTKLKATAAQLGPTGYGVENGGVAGTNGVLFTPLRQPITLTENQIPAGSSKTFTWLWRAPDIATETAYTFTVYVYKPDNAEVTITPAFTVTVDGLEPYKVSMVATVSGLTLNNFAGPDDNVVVTLTANEELTSIGQLYIENVGSSANNVGLTCENVKPPVSFVDSGDQKTWTAEFSTTGWLENWENLRLRIGGPWATDSYGLDNTSDCQIDNFVFDMRPPHFGGDNGLRTFSVLPVRRQPGTTNFYRENTILSIDNISIAAEDNTSRSTQGVRRGWCTVTVYVNDVEISSSAYNRMSDNRVNIVPLTLNEGNNNIRVRATDPAGNYCENSIENIFIDNTPPTVSVVQITKRNTTTGAQEWVDFTAGMTTNDNRPGIRLKIQDLGWGVTIENLRVMLDNLENTQLVNPGVGGGASFMAQDNFLIHDNQPAVWDNGACTGTYNWENYIRGDNGIPSGNYYIRVWVSDNVLTTSSKTMGFGAIDAVRDNENFIFKFVVDVTAPTAPPTANLAGSVTGGASAAAATGTTSSSCTLSGTAEVSTTIKVYTTTDAGVTWTEYTAGQTTADAAGNWSASVTLTEGQTTGIAVTATDSGGNESTRTVYGYMTYDATGPTVAITSPTTGASTDQTSIVVTGTVGKNTWEIYTDLTASVQVGSAASGTLTIGSDGSFTVSATLSEGANTVTIRVTDGAGNLGSASVTITRTVTPWATYAIIIVIVALILAAIAIFRKK